MFVITTNYHTAVALCEIHHYQKDTSSLIPKSPFQHLVREIVWELTPNICFQSLAIEALQKAAEAFLVVLFESEFFLSYSGTILRYPGTQLAAIHRGRVTIDKKDMVLVQRIVGDWCEGPFLPTLKTGK